MKITSRLVCLIFAVLFASPALALNATWNVATDIPVTAASYAASGTVNFTLNFAPPTGTNLTVVNNTGQGFISGTFSNLTQGQAISLNYNGTNYLFVANYYGGTGNDLVLQWANVRPMAWGLATSGELGNGSIVNSNVPVPVTLSGVLLGKIITAVASGERNSVALCSDGTLAAWGANYFGQLGNNSTTESSVPVAVVQNGALAGKTVVAISAGLAHCLALCSDGTLVAWGYNTAGQLGNNSTTTSLTPVAVVQNGVLSGKTIVSVSAGGVQSLALCSDGTLAAWGNNYFGQLGNNSTTDSSVPVLVVRSGVLSGKTVVFVAGGKHHSLALCSDGTLAAWGRNDYYGQLGNNSTTSSSVPVLVLQNGVLSGKTVIAASAGVWHNLALCSDGTLVSWGKNLYGELGNSSTTDSSVPVLVVRNGVLSGKTVVAVSGGDSLSMALCSDGTVASWGDYYFGKLGNNGNTSSSVPVTVSTSTLATGERFVTVSNGGTADHALVIVASPPPPTAATTIATFITTTGATVNGTVNANNSSAAVSFDYGTSASYGTNVAGTPTPVTGSSTTPVSANLTGLTPGTTYHFRVNGVSTGGNANGNDLTFTTIPSPISGTKSVGPTGNYASIGAAIADIQAQSLGGALVLELQPTYLSTVESFPLTFTNLGTTAVNTVTLRPQTGAVGLAISSANTTAATVDLNGAQFVTIDGRPAGAGTAKQLTIANTNTNGVAVRFINAASDNILQYLTLQGVNFTNISGTVVFSTTTGANGNDNNTIDHCDIRDGATTPVNAIYSFGSTNTFLKPNSGNTVSNCNIFNFYSSVNSSSGVTLVSGNTDWTITGNSFYQTASRASANIAARGVYINNTSGNNFTITGNTIGGSAPNAGGTAWTTTGTQSYKFVGIEVGVGPTTPSSVQGNTIGNIVWTTSDINTAPPGVWCGILASAGSVNIGTLIGNVIGSGTGTGSISVTDTGGTGTIFGIASQSGGTVAIANNTIGSITTNANTGGGASLIGIQVTSGTNSIASNTIGSTTTANSLNAATAATGGGATPQQVTGILSSSSGSASITGNTVANLNNNYAGANAGQVRGVVTSAGANTITGNTVRNLTTTSLNSFPATSGSALGIAQSSTTANQTVSQNVVHSLSNTAASGSVSVTGIYYAGNTTTGTNVIARNLVHSLSISSASLTVLTGMEFGSGTFTAQNNMVRVGLDASGVSTAGGAQLRGIYDNGTSEGRNFYHNSVYSGGTQTATASVTTAFTSTGATNARDFRNNIFVSTRSRGGTATGAYLAVNYGGTTANPPGLTASNNIFFASGTGSLLGSYNGPFISTLSAWRTATGQDAASAVGDPLFINPNGTAATVNLHLQASNPAEGGGVPVATVTDDFDGQTRSIFTPVDIGADAGNFTVSTDLFAPAISYPLLTSGSTANRVLTGWATITDNIGVSSGASVPRFYFKKSTDADVFGVANNSTGNGWKYVTATGSGPYSFTLDYSLINGGSVAAGDTIQYFVVAQDAVNNLGSNPVATATASANPPVQNVNAHGAVNSFSILSTFNGTVTVGSGGTYPSLSGAGGLFAALNGAVLTGNVVVNITSDVTETGGVTLNEMRTDEYPPTRTLTIQPGSATMWTISGSAANGLITFNGADRVSIDGRFGGTGRYLTFRNTSAASTASTILFINDASNNTVRSSIVEGATTSGVFLGVIAFSTGTVTGNDNNLITDCQVRDLSTAAGVPVALIGALGSSAAVSNSGNTVSNNELFNFNAKGVKIWGTGNDSWTISGNNLYEANAATGLLTGIDSQSGGTNFITGNFIHDLVTTGTSSTGITFDDAGTTTVSRNRITAFNVNAATTQVIGIFVNGSASPTLNVVNNQITISPATTVSSTLYGIWDNSSTGTVVNVFHNSILIGGTESGTANSWASFRRRQSTTTSRNNIFFNNRSGGTGSHFAAGRENTGGGYTANNNVYAGTGASPASFMDFNAVTFTPTPVTFATWQSSTGGDANSSAGNPGTGNFTTAMFVDAANGDLHIVPAGNPLVSGTGISIAGVTTDFDGETRSTIAPYIGADEIPAPVVTMNPTNTTVNIGASAIFTATATGAPVPTVQWQVNTGSGFSNLPGETAATLTITGATFPLNGNQYRAVFTNIAGTANSNAAVLTVNRPPVASPVTVTRYPTQGTKLSAAQILAQTSDPDAGDTLSVVSVGNVTPPAHGTVLLNFGFVFYTPNANDQNADTFSYTVQDSHGSTATGTVNVNIIVDNAPSHNITKLTVLPNGDVAIDFSGIPGFTYGLQFSPDLIAPWVNIGPVTTNGFGAAHAVDTPAHGPGGSGFYRLIYPAPAGL